MNEDDVRESYSYQKTKTGDIYIDEYCEQVFNNMDVQLVQIKSLVTAKRAYLRLRDFAAEAE